MCNKIFVVRAAESIGAETANQIEGRVRKRERESESERKAMTKPTGMNQKQ